MSELKKVLVGLLLYINQITFVTPPGFKPTASGLQVCCIDHRTTAATLIKTIILLNDILLHELLGQTLQLSISITLSEILNLSAHILAHFLCENCFNHVRFEWFLLQIAFLLNKTTEGNRNIY